MASLINIDSSTVSGVNIKTDDFEVLFSPPIFLGIKPWEIALINASLWYSWFNIKADNNNQNVSYFNGAVNRSVVFPEGQYTINQLNDELHRQMEAFGDFTVNAQGNNEYDIDIEANFSTLRVRIGISGGYTLDLTVSDLYLLLGFDSIVVTTTQEGSGVANINDSINSLAIECSIIESVHKNNDSSSNILYTFVPEVGPGSNIRISPAEPVYVPLNANGGKISRIRMRIVDNLNRRVNLNGEPTSYLLSVRPQVNQHSMEDLLVKLTQSFDNGLEKLSKRQ